jgi:cytochrome c-type biogenesis protein CcmH
VSTAVNRCIFVLFCALFVIVIRPAWAVLPSEKLSDPALEARSLALSKAIRCVVCQNQSIDDSSAPLAADLRILLRERIAAGDTDDQVINYLVQRYGNFVLLKPPFQPDTWFLWLSPFGVLAFALAAFAVQIQRNRLKQPWVAQDDDASDLLI